MNYECSQDTFEPRGKIIFNSLNEYCINDGSSGYAVMVGFIEIYQIEKQLFATLSLEKSFVMCYRHNIEGWMTLNSS